MAGKLEQLKNNLEAALGSRIVSLTQALGEITVVVNASRMARLQNSAAVSDREGPCASSSADIERNLTVHDPEQLRNSAALRESVADEADAILERMHGAFA